MDERIEGLDQRIVVWDIVEELGRTNECHLIIVHQMRNNRAEPVWFGYHVCIERCDIFTSTIVKLRHEVRATCQVPSFEVMWDAFDLDPGVVVKIRKLDSEIIDSSLQVGIFSVIKDYDAEAILGIVDCASSSSSIEDNINVFSATRDKNINSGDLIALDAELWSAATTNGKYLVELMQ